MNGTQIFHWEVFTGKTGLPLQKFHFFRKFSSGTNRKIMFHLQPNRNFQSLLVNGKRPMSVIDIFSQFLFLRPLQSKETSDVAEHGALLPACVSRS